MIIPFEMEYKRQLHLPIFCQYSVEEGSGKRTNWSFATVNFQPSPHFPFSQIGLVQSPNCFFKQRRFSVSRTEKRGNWEFGPRIISMLMRISLIVIKLMSLAAFVKAKQMLTWHHSGGASEKTFLIHCFISSLF